MKLRTILVGASALASVIALVGITSTTAGAASSENDCVLSTPFVAGDAVTLDKPGDYGAVSDTYIELTDATGVRTRIGDTGGCNSGATSSSALPLNGVGINPLDGYAYAAQDTLSYWTGPTPPADPKLYRFDRDGTLEPTTITIPKPVTYPYPDLQLRSSLVSPFSGTVTGAGHYRGLGYTLDSKYSSAGLVMESIGIYISDVDLAAGTVTWQQSTLDASCAPLYNNFVSGFYTDKATAAGFITDWVYDETTQELVAVTGGAESYTVRVDSAGAMKCALNGASWASDEIVVGMAILDGKVVGITSLGNYFAVTGEAITKIGTSGVLNGDMGSFDTKLYDAAPAVTITKSANAASVAVGTDATFALTVTNTGNVMLQKLSVSDLAATLTCTPPDYLAPNDSFECSAAMATTQEGQLSNTASVTGEDLLAASVNSESTATVDVTADPTSSPTATETTEPTATETLEPTATSTTEPTATETPESTSTASSSSTGSADVSGGPSSGDDSGVVVSAADDELASTGISAWPMLALAAAFLLAGFGLRATGRRT